MQPYIYSFVLSVIEFVLKNTFKTLHFVWFYQKTSKKIKYVHAQLYYMENFKWTPLKHKAAYLLATELKKYYEIADMLGVTVQTLWNWRQNKEFSREVKRISDSETRAWVKNQAVILLESMRSKIR